MHSGTLLAALSWYRAPSEEARRYIETEARLAARGADPLGVAEAEETALREAWVQAIGDFEDAHTVYTAAKTEEARLAAGHALLALESAHLYFKAAMTAKEFVGAALLAA